jgi:acyl-CoA reductase-like NAD-dependent aldehyde dehydrogenase
MSRSNAVLLSTFLLSALVLPLSAQARFADPTVSDQTTLQLGEIQVAGQKQLIQALRAIKVALKRPESTDPSQRGVIVCRLDKDIGTHEKDLLTCATNATLQKRRADTQIAWLLGCTGAAGSRCLRDPAFYASDDVVLGKIVNASSARMLKVQVDGAALRKLLAGLPDPTPAEALPAGTVPTPAPSADTSGQD